MHSSYWNENCKTSSNQIVKKFSTPNGFYFRYNDSFLTKYEFSSILPAKSIGNHSTGKASEHTTDSKNANGHGIKLFHRVLRYVFAVPVLVYVLHEIFNVLKILTRHC